MSRGESAPGILFVSNFRSDVGYAWSFIERLWKGIADHPVLSGYTCHVSFPKVGRVSDLVASTDWTVHEVDVGREMATVLRLIRRHRIRVVYLSDWPFWSARFALFRAVGVRTIIVHDHTPGLRTAPGPAMGLVKSLVANLRMVACDAAIGVGDFVVHRIREVNRVPSNRIFRVTNGIEPGPEPPRRAERARVRIVTASRANRYKGIDFAVDVVAELVGRGVEVEYLFMGDGPDLESFRKRSVRRGLEDRIDFPGEVSDVPRRLLAADVAFHPSKGEALSLAILEYMRAGLPVVVPDNPSVNSPVTDGRNALIYREGDVGSAADALQQLVGSVDRRRELGSDARRTLLAKHTTTTMFEELHQAVSQILG